MEITHKMHTRKEGRPDLNKYVHIIFPYINSMISNSISLIPETTKRWKTGKWVLTIEFPRHGWEYFGTGD